MNPRRASEKPAEGESAADTEQRIRQRACLLSEAEGKQDGVADPYWQRARELIQEETKSHIHRRNPGATGLRGHP